MKTRCVSRGLLVTLVKLVDRLPLPALPAKRGRGHPQVYPDRLFLKAVVIMIVRHLHTVHELLSVVAQPTQEMTVLRELLTEQGRYPTRRTWKRQMFVIPETLPAQIGCLGRHLVDLIEPWATCGRAVAIDSTSARARVAASGIRSIASKGKSPIPRLIPKPDFPKSGWHALVYGWKLHVVSLVAAIWFPIAAVLTPANVADSERASELLRELPAEVRFILGDRHYNTPELHELCAQDDRLLVTTKYGRYPHTDDGVEVRRIFHKLRSIAMENFNEHFKGIFDGHKQVRDL